MTYEDILGRDTDSRMVVGEPALKLEATTMEKIAYLRANLHPSTIEYLESRNWMVEKTFPYDDSASDLSWTEESEESNPIISNDVIIQDRKAWLNAI